MKKRINLYFVILTMAAILAVVAILTPVFYSILKEEAFSHLKSYAELMVDSDIWGIESEPYKVQDFIKKDSNFRVTLIGSDGQALLDTYTDVDSMDNHGERPEISMAFSAGEGRDIRKSSTMGKDVLYYAIILDNGCVLRVSKEQGSVTGLLLTSFPKVLCLCIVLFLVCVFLSQLLTKSIVEPIEQLGNNLDSADSIRVYKELVPFVNTIRKQHDDILKNATMRQEFTANVSHELKTPLTSISGYSELIESGMATDQDVTRFAGEIHKNSKRLLTLINDIIRLSELDSTSEDENYEDIDLYDIAETCVDMLKINAENNDVTINLSGSHQVVHANRQMMEELVYNLCDNAIRYNKAGGRVDVKVDREKIDDNKKDQTDQEISYDAVVLQVRDTGIGISEEHQGRIFERFYRVDKSRSKLTGGTGLGLAIVKHIVAKHPSAHIELDSTLGEGTDIRVVFRV